jgi:hypothetical protein
MFYSAEADIFDDLGLNPPQLSFYAKNFNASAPPSAAQLVSNGFPSALPQGSATSISGPVKTTGPTRKIPRILEWNLSVQHQFAQNWVTQIGFKFLRRARHQRPVHPAQFRKTLLCTAT